MENFIKVLEEKGYSYGIEGDTVVVTEGGYVDLSNLTSITTNVKFENSGYVDLSNLTSITTNVKFNTKGGVYLYKLTSITGNVKFENSGYVDMPNYKGTIIHRNKEFKVKIVDYYTMLIESEKTVSDFKVYDCYYFYGIDIKDLKSCYVAEKGEFTAHGETVREAISDCNFKHLQSILNLDDKRRV